MIGIKHNKKKILGIILSLCMILSIVPITALAEGSSDDGSSGSTGNVKVKTKFDVTAQVTIKDASGNIIETTSVNKTTDFIDNNDDDVQQTKVKEIKNEIAEQFVSRGTVTEDEIVSTELIFDHFENGDLIIGDPDDAFKNTSCIYEIYKTTYNLTVQEAGDNSDNDTSYNIIDEVSFVQSTSTPYKVGDAPEPRAIPIDPNQSNYTFCEVWEELEQVDNEWKLVGYWSSDENRLNTCPEDERIKTFKADRKYVYTIIVQPKEGYVFSDKVSDDKYYLEIVSDEMTPVNPVVREQITYIDVSNVTVNFKEGDEPVFTGEVPEDALYFIDFEAWKAEDEGLASREFWNNDNHLSLWGGKLMTTFKKNKTYTYMIYIKLKPGAWDAGWTFGPNTILRINGKEVAYTSDGADYDWQVMMMTTELSVTPEAINTPDNGGANNGNTDNTNNSTDNNTANAGSSNNTDSTAATTDNANTSTAPQTGDNMNVILWMTILLACGSVVIGMRAYSSKKL